MPSSTRFEGKKGIYEIIRPEPVILGRVAVFFAARQVSDDQPLLIKSFRNSDDDDSARTFYREIEALQRLRHPNVLEIIDYGVGSDPNAPPFLVLPWCKGGNLRELQRQRDFLPIESAIPILRQIAAAIDYAHQQGVIHGDIKPQNVLLSDDGRHAYLTDFGMAKYFKVADNVVSKEHEAGGTSAFLSPEQLERNRQTPSSDIYSFGLLAFELLTGRLPFDLSAPLFAQLAKRVEGDIMAPGEANPALTSTVQAALLSALAVDPGSRPDSAGEFCDVLIGARPAKASRPRARPRREKVRDFWQGLEAPGKAGVITAAIAAIAGMFAALVQVIPALLGKK